MGARDEDLVPLLRKARGFKRVMLAAELGDSEGESGPGALRNLLGETGKGTRDLRCAALLALAKRCHEDASDDYAAALSSKDWGTKHYAMIAMAAYGKDGQWDRLLGDLERRLAPGRRRAEDPYLTDVQQLVVYLCRHLDGDQSRLERLVARLRARWDALLTAGDVGADEVAWLRRFWPDVAPDGPAASGVAPPDSAGMTVWIRSNPLFAPI
jgi:hypothetical protein